jgi:hypothetical protein
MTALRTFDNPAATIIYEAINQALTREELEHLARRMWGCEWAKGTINDDDANFLQTMINRRQPVARSPDRRPIRGPAGRLGSFFKPRERRQLTDEQRKAARERRRVLGGSAVLPPQLRARYTLGQMAVLAIVAGEIKHHGICDLCIDKIAALAGVCRTTVQTTLHNARVFGHIRITPREQTGASGKKCAPNLTNLIDIVSAEWRTWIKRGPTAHRPIGSSLHKLPNLTKNIDIKKYRFTRVERQKADFRREQAARAWPPDERRRA